MMTLGAQFVKSDNRPNAPPPREPQKPPPTAHDRTEKIGIVRQTGGKNRQETKKTGRLFCGEPEQQKNQKTTNDAGRKNT